MLWLIPVGMGVGTLIAGVTSAAARKPLPADIAGTIRSALASKTDATIQSALAAIGDKYPKQVNLIYKAWGATKDHAGKTNVPADIDALYLNSFFSGDPANMKAVAKALDVKYHYLAKHLLDVAGLLANLTGAS
jgi:hypothetical protein